jgi:phosphoinositide-3-kinase regulatory subunit 4
MGNANYRQGTQAAVTQDPRVFLQNDIPKFISQDLISRGKFMKIYTGKIDGAQVIVKVYLRSQEEDLHVLPSVIRKLTNIWKVLSPSKHPNILPYQIWIKSSYKIPKSNLSPTYLIRQYLLANLYDRLSTRPFLHNIEKRFLVYQLMRCLEICHEQNIYHGDIKPENVMVTSWNWVVLTDFSPYKPTNIPVDDPADFQYFFDSMGRRRCYIAPERFYSKSNVGKVDDSSSGADGSAYIEELEKLGNSRPIGASSSFDDGATELTAAMDVFSLGCTIAEVYRTFP